MEAEPHDRQGKRNGQYLIVVELNGLSVVIGYDRLTKVAKYRPREKKKMAKKETREININIIIVGV